MGHVCCWTHQPVDLGIGYWVATVMPQPLLALILVTGPIKVDHSDVETCEGLCAFVTWDSNIQLTLALWLTRSIDFRAALFFLVMLLISRLIPSCKALRVLKLWCDQLVRHFRLSLCLGPLG